MIEARAGQALFGRLLQLAHRSLGEGRPMAAEPDSWRKARQNFAPKMSVDGGIGLLEISGILAYRPDLGDMIFDGFEDSAEVLTAFRRLEADSETNAIVLNINSPGGFSVGGAEIADAVHNSAKPTVAWVGGMMCSLAYWIGSQASAVIATRSAMVGSIGAYVSVVDYHRMLANAGIEVKLFRTRRGPSRRRGCPERRLPMSTPPSSPARRNVPSMSFVPMSCAPATVCQKTPCRDKCSMGNRLNGKAL